MNQLPKSLKQISLFLERLPGIGEKTANRLAFYLLRLPDPDLKEFSRAIADLKIKTKLCRICFNFTESEICSICSDKQRDQTTITVVESVLDLLSLEQGGIYHGVYHVLHGRIDPLNNIGPEDIYINQLLDRVRPGVSRSHFVPTKVGTSLGTKITEVILATNPDMEGEATAMYIKNKLKVQLVPRSSKDEVGSSKFKVTRLGYGLPIGANLEYADYMTLRKALENRNQF